jgi:HEAT repeat protein
VAIGAAYELGSTPSGLDVLFDRFVSDDVELRSIAAYGVVRAGEQAVPGLLARLGGANADLAERIMDVIGDIGPKAVDAVPEATTLSASPEPLVRRASVEALGLLTQQHTTLDAAVVAALARALDDEDAIVVRNATFAVSRLGAKACTQSIVDQLHSNLDHWHHHVRGWSIEALQRLDDPKALKIALRYLMAARWDPSTKSGDRGVTSETMRESSQ